MTHSGQSDQLALAVCRLALDPLRGRLRRPHQVGIAVRAALFTELARSGRLLGTRSPQAIGESDTGDPLLDALHRAVAGRHPTAWKRWYSHIDADRTAATDALIATGRWASEAGRLVDANPGATVAEQQRVAALLSGRQVPDTVDLTLLVLLCGGYGAGQSRPAPRRSRRLVEPWLKPQLATAGRGGDATLAALDAAFAAMRRVNPIPFPSR